MSIELTLVGDNDQTALVQVDATSTVEDLKALILVNVNNSEC